MLDTSAASANILRRALSSNSYERGYQPPGVTMAHQGEAHRLHPLSAQRFMAERLKARPHHAALAPNSLTASAKSVHRRGQSRGAKTLYQPLLDSSIAGNGSSIAPPFPSGCSMLPGSYERLTVIQLGSSSRPTCGTVCHYGPRPSREPRMSSRYGHLGRCGHLGGNPNARSGLCPVGRQGLVCSVLLVAVECLLGVDQVIGPDFSPVIRSASAALNPGVV